MYVHKQHKYIEGTKLTCDIETGQSEGLNFKVGPFQTLDNHWTRAKFKNKTALMWGHWNLCAKISYKKNADFACVPSWAKGSNQSGSIHTNWRRNRRWMKTTKKKGIKTIDTHAHVKCWSRTSGKYRRAVNLSCPSLDHLPLHRPLLLRHAAPRRLCVQINPSPFFCISTPCYCWCVAHFKVRFRKKKNSIWKRSSAFVSKQNPL